MIRSLPPFLKACGAVLFIFAALPAWGTTTSKLKFDLGYNTFFESNIYHSYADTDETESMLNVVSSRLTWKYKPSRKFRQKLNGFADFDLYPNYSNRNKSSFGVAYSPLFRYSSRGRLSGKFSFSRRNRELIDDQGKNQNRILTKWKADLSLNHRYTLGKWFFEQSFFFSNDNYDETDTVTAAGTDTTLRSYDYHSSGWRFRAGYRIVHRIKARISFETVKRNYAERRTYSVQYGAVAGRPFAIREFRENTGGLQVRYYFYRKNSVRLEFDYTIRKDDFENFYGYHQSQYVVAVTAHPSNRLQTDIFFRIKAKNYDNYWTRRIGSKNVVSVDYADFRVEQSYQLTDIVWLRLFVRNYNKVSNDPAFDYHDLTGGFGVGVTY